MKKTLFLMTAALGMAVAFVGCEKTDKDVKVIGVELAANGGQAGNQIQHSMNIGDTLFLEIIVLPADATNKEVSWIFEAQDTTIAAVFHVNDKVMIIAQKEGNLTTSVTTAEGNFTATCAVTIVDDGEGEIPSGWFDGTITAVVENGNDYNSIISKVSAEVYWETDDDGDYVEIASGNWSNGGFSITLPTPAPKLLKSMDGFFFDEPHVLVTEFSDRDAKGTFVSFFAYGTDGRTAGKFEYYKEDENSYIHVEFVYMDRDVTITGIHSVYSAFIVNLSLKKGWNKVYYSEIETANGLKGGLTTQEASGVKWHFYSWGDDDYYSAPKAKQATKKSECSAKRNARFSRFGK